METQPPTELFRDAWLPPVDAAAELDADAPEDAMCFVTSERRVWTKTEAGWIPVGPIRSRD